ncbi:MAG: outer membrane beta-barrel domain-containing protein [Bdellovibrionota bacterium]|mgnify:CR=1 FL=1
MKGQTKSSPCWWLVVLTLSFPIAKSQLAQAGDEYNFNWLDPEKKVYVLQNRRYLKSPRVLFSLMGGPALSNPYRDTWKVDPRIAFYINEQFGIEAFYSFFANSENSNYKALTYAAKNTLPVIREIRSSVGGLLHWVPWYAKINFFNQILYFDWYLAAGAGMLGTAIDTRTSADQLESFVTQNRFAGFWGTGHQYHLSKYFTVRLDFMGAVFRAPLYGKTGDFTWYSDYTFGAGVGLRL